MSGIDEAVDFAMAKAYGEKGGYTRYTLNTFHRALRERGYVVVPVEPTQSMHDAARDWSQQKYGKAIGKDASDGCYRAMLEAAR